ncbi:MAG: acylphosphatase [Chloroflexi bacterium]|nr:acylphosphatase [Chloroflexota bacterium]
MTDADEIRQWTVTGRVQRVGFRAFVQREANRLGLRGTVRNTSDGAVEVVAAGTSDQLEKLAEKLRKGPPASRVEAVLPADDPRVSLAELPADFRIVR